MRWRVNNDGGLGGRGWRGPGECASTARFICGRLVLRHHGGVFCFSLTSAKSSAGRELGLKTGVFEKLEKSRSSLITDGLELIGRGLKTAAGVRILYIGRESTAREMVSRSASVRIVLALKWFGSPMPSIACCTKLPSELSNLGGLSSTRHGGAVRLVRSYPSALACNSHQTTVDSLMFPDLPIYFNANTEIKVKRRMMMTKKSAKTNSSSEARAGRTLSASAEGQQSTSHELRTQQSPATLRRLAEDRLRHFSLR